MAKPDPQRALQVQQALRNGLCSPEIQRTVGVCRATVSYHAKRLGLSTRTRPIYNWTAIRAALESGARFAAVVDQFGCSLTALYDAARRGKIVLPPKLPSPQWLSPEALAERLMGREGRGPRWRMKRKLLKAGRLKYACALCGIAEWRGLPLTLRLDHIDGIRTNFAVSNLRLLCANCDSQQDTYCDRNIGRKQKAPIA